MPRNSLHIGCTNVAALLSRTALFFFMVQNLSLFTTEEFSAFHSDITHLNYAIL